MPFKSKAQQRFMFAAEARGEVPKGTARRWAHHTKDMKKLPEKKTDTKAAAAALEKAAFAAAFVDGCKRAGVTDPARVAELAEKFARSLLSVKRAQSVGDIAGGAVGGLTTGAVAGTLAFPAIGGLGLGYLTGALRNKSDRDDVEILRLAAEANAYRRRAAAAKTHAQVRKVLASDPGKYVLIG